MNIMETSFYNGYSILSYRMRKFKRLFWWYIKHINYFVNIICHCGKRRISRRGNALCSDGSGDC